MADYEKQQHASEAASSTGEVSVFISDHQNNSVTCNGNTTVLENGLANDTPLSKRQTESSGCYAPEKKLTLLALRLAVLEKAATGLGSLGFLWATLVLQAGFAMALNTVDFWFVATILATEGARIFSRSSELEWQHNATKSTDKTSSSETEQLQQQDNKVVDVPQRTWTSSEVPFLGYDARALKSCTVSVMLFWLQLVSASTCIILSVLRLSKQTFVKGDTDKRNRQAALNIFYSLALAEALLFLAEKLYGKFQFERFLKKVSSCYGLKSDVPIRRFFFDTLSKCINGSVFDGLKMDLVSFTVELLGSDSQDEQLIGARFLYQLTRSDKRHACEDILRHIGTSTATLERLVEMLHRKRPFEEDMRSYAAEVMLKLASKKQNVLRVAAIPGSIESIASLITRPVDSDDKSKHMKFSLPGLGILKRLARNQENCSKIASTSNLLLKIIEFTGAVEEWLTWPPPKDDREKDRLKDRMKVVKRSLRLLQMLANASGATGKSLRREIVGIVYTVGNLRDIVRHGGEHRLFQKLALEILTCLTLEADARSRIGAAGGMVPDLFSVFVANMSKEAGNTLAMLTLDNCDNCQRMLRVKDLDKGLVAALRNPEVRDSATRILTNLSTYGDSHSIQLLSKAAPMVLGAIKTEKMETPQILIGLAVQIFRLVSQEEIEQAFRKASIMQTDLFVSLVEILKYYKKPSMKEPKLRKFTIELMIEMLKPSGKIAEHIITHFKDEGVKDLLQNVADTTSELELYDVFSGEGAACLPVSCSLQSPSRMSGLNGHEMSIESLVGMAMGLLSTNRVE